MQDIPVCHVNLVLPEALISLTVSYPKNIPGILDHFITRRNLFNLRNKPICILLQHLLARLDQILLKHSWIMIIYHLRQILATWIMKLIRRRNQALVL